MAVRCSTTNRIGRIAPQRRAPKRRTSDSDQGNRRRGRDHGSAKAREYAMPTMPLAKQILALWILLPPVFVVSLLLAFVAPLLYRAPSAPVKPSRYRIPVTAKDRDLTDGVRSR